MDMFLGNQQSDSVAVIKVVGEPAMVINGVPNVASDGKTTPTSVRTQCNADTEDPCFGEWLEGRKVRKLFGDRYYPGKVAKYLSEDNWYRVVYEDGDVEDLEWHELEEVLVPLDICIPLKTLAMERFKSEKSVHESVSKAGRPRKSDMKNEAGIQNTTELLKAPSANNEMGNQFVVLRMEENTPEAVKMQKETREKNSIESMPRKERRSTSSNHQSEKDSSSSSLAFLSSPDATIMGDTVAQEARRKREIHKRSMLTARAEKQKRKETLRVPGTSPGI